MEFVCHSRVAQDFNGLRAVLDHHHLRSGELQDSRMDHVDALSGQA